MSVDAALEVIEERARRIDAALCEVGFVDCVIVEDGGIVFHARVPRATMWRAAALTEPLPQFPCWPCLEAHDAPGEWPVCDHDWRIERWPDPIPR